MISTTVTLNNGSRHSTMNSWSAINSNGFLLTRWDRLFWRLFSLSSCSRPLEQSIHGRCLYCRLVGLIVHLNTRWLLKFTSCTLSVVTELTFSMRACCTASQYNNRGEACKSRTKLYRWDAHLRQSRNYRPWCWCEYRPHRVDWSHQSAVSGNPGEFPLLPPASPWCAIVCLSQRCQSEVQKIGENKFSTPVSRWQRETVLSPCKVQVWTNLAHWQQLASQVGRLSKSSKPGSQNPTISSSLCVVLMHSFNAL